MVGGDVAVGGGGGWWCFFLCSTLRYRTGKEGEVEKVAAAVSDPKSPSYGKFLSAQELRSVIPPRAQHRSTVVGRN